MNNRQSGGIGLFGLLTVLFIGLKLTGYVTWSWLWVLSPLWLPLTVVLGVILLVWVLASIGLGLIDLFKKEK